jgi:hypothetical protein
LVIGFAKRQIVAFNQVADIISENVELENGIIMDSIIKADVDAN